MILPYGSDTVQRLSASNTVTKETSRQLTPLSSDNGSPPLQLDLVAASRFSVAGMDISVIDSASAMTLILDAPQGQRADLVRAMWKPMADMYRYAPGEVDLAQVHRQGFGFSWEESIDSTREALDALIQADAWNRVESALHDGLAALQHADPAAKLPDIKVLLVIGDSSNAHFMEEIKGLSAFGGMSGYISITLWPTKEVLERLEAIVVHELHHNVRYSPGNVVWNPMTVTVGEQVISEGLADVFAAELYGDRGYSHFVSAETYNDDDVLAKVASGLDVTGMQNFTVWVHGDASARLFGLEPVGLPTGAGYAVGARLVRAYLDATDSTAAQNVRASAAEVIKVAFDQLELGN